MIIEKKITFEELFNWIKKNVPNDTSKTFVMSDWNRFKFKIKSSFDTVEENKIYSVIFYNQEDEDNCALLFRIEDLSDLKDCIDGDISVSYTHIDHNICIYIDHISGYINFQYDYDDIIPHIISCSYDIADILYDLVKYGEESSTFERIE